MRLIYAKDRKAFYSHIRLKSAGKRTGVNLCTNNTSLTEYESAETLLHMFSSNFSTASTAPAISSISDASLRFISSPTIITEMLHNCPNSDSIPDGLLFRLLKAIDSSILSPLNTVFQRSMSEGKFPVIWKEAIVLPLYKGKGKQSSPDNYRLISICQCIEKILEKIVNAQLAKYVCDNQLLCNKPHGFTTGHSTLTNLLTCDSTIANIMLAHHPYDILSFDFAKAFDKAPHSSILTAVANIGVGGQALDWLDSYLTNRTFRVRVGSNLSSSTDVTSDVNQGSCIGPTLYRIFIDFLLRKINLPSEAFANNLKFIIDVAINPRDAVQKEVNVLSDWATLHGMPLSVEKCTVLHCGPHQPNHTYYINSVAITRILA